jgi:hypothetical protein
MNAHAWVLILAVIALTLGLAARLRAARTGSGAPSQSANLLVPCAIIIGTLPWALQLGETAKIAASVASIIVSLAAIVLLILQARRTGRAESS